LSDEGREDNEAEKEIKVNDVVSMQWVNTNRCTIQEYTLIVFIVKTNRLELMNHVG
jgi:hypothetical protein